MQVAYVTVLPPFLRVLQAILMKLHEFRRLIDKQKAEL